MYRTLSALQALFSRQAILPRRRGREAFRSCSLGAERLETRAMLAADAPSPINRFSFMAAGEPQAAYVDVNGEGLLNSTDLLSVYNEINAAQGEQIRVRLEVTDLSGNPVERLLPGQEFQLRALVTDLREPANDPQRGVFSAYVDVRFDETKVSADVADRDITYGDPGDAQSLFPGGHRTDDAITATAGKLEDIGAFANQTPYGSQEEILFVVPMQVAADAISGPLSFIVEDDMTVLFDTSVFGSNEAVPADEILFVGDQVTIGFPPAVVNDTAMVIEDVPDNIIDVLANDTPDPEGEAPLTVVDVTQGANGAVTIIDNGQRVRYTPGTNVFGQDTFTYTVEDADGNRAVGTVTVNITSDNDPPAASPDTFTVNAGETTELDVLVNDSIAPDTGETLRVSSVTTGSAGGTITISQDQTRILYTPAAGFTGTETFSYGASDRPDFTGLVSTAMVTVTVRDNNPITGDDFATVAEDSQDNAIDVLANDEPDPGVGGELEIVSAEVMGDAGTVTVGPNGDTIIFTPAADFAGMALLSYRVADEQGGESTGMVVVTVTNVNDPPNANDDTLSVAEDSADNTLSVLGNDVIAPDTGEMLTITAVGQTSNGGVVTIAPSNTSLVYTPPAGFVGQDAFTYTISDGNGGSDTATVVVTITDATETPVANDDTATAAEDSSDNSIDVLANDTDPDAGDTLTVMAVTQGSRGGTVEIAEDGLSVLYTPAANVFGEETFTYTASDGNGGTDTATVTVQITAANDPPTAVNDTATVVEESTDNTIDVLTNDSIAPDDTGTLEITAVSTPSAGGSVEIAEDGLSLIYTPAANFAGTETFAYTIDDGSGIPAMATVTVTVTNTQDPPTANDDAISANEDQTVTIDVLDNDTDPDTGTTFTISEVSDTDHGGMVTISEDGMSLVYMPESNFNGVDTFTYTISDGNGGTDTATVTVTVVPVNDPPPIADDQFTAPEDVQDRELDVLANDITITNPDGTETFTIETVSTGSAGGTIDIAEDEQSLLYTPAANFVGTETFTYTISDAGGQMATATVSVTVTAVNDAPVLANDTFQVESGSSGTTLNVLANDDDAEDDTLTITAVAQISNGGAVTIGPNGQNLVYTPAAGFVGTETFTYTVSDNNGGSATATVTVNVTGIQTSSLSGFVYVDSNRNGVKDGGEQPLANVSIRLWGTDIFNQSVNITTTTDANGAYRFTGLVPGSYVIEETQPAGFADSVESLGSLGATASTAGHDQFFLALGAGQNGANYNFGERGLQTGIIGRHNFFRP